MLQPAEQQALIADFKAAVTGLYGNRLAKVILYGSYARGDAHEESDVDFLVVLKDEQIKKYREIMGMSEVVHPLILKHNVEISFQPYSLSQFLYEKSPLLHWVRKEGFEV
ncbi:MAG: nucleotidyltransferase domain-containing protein [Bacteroidetes bacterium]|nr:nucleotidyltransferase domain-containing protein [Bacteroidota bacterium]